MPRILLVKTSSLGDVVHNLPVASDVARAVPGVEIDWAVEETFASIPSLHPAVREILPLAIRRWRRRPFAGDTWREVRAYIDRLRSRSYDAVIDTQGLLKSALVTRAARGARYGMGWRASREPLFPFYDRTFDVSRDLHAVERNRLLAAQALGYNAPETVDYGIAAPANNFSWLRVRRYAVFLHATSADEKLWPEGRWTALGEHMADRGIGVVFPWGNAEERLRSERLALAVAGGIAPPALKLAELPALLTGAVCVVGVDTGLTHLAAALRVPTVGIYGKTDPRRTGLFGSSLALNVGGRGSSPGAQDALHALEKLLR